MSEYSKNQIFTNGNVNAIIDRLHYEIATGMPGIILQDVMCLTGRAAAQLQGDLVASCNNVIFLVNDAALYAYIQGPVAKKLNENGVLKYKERTIFYFSGLIIEIWKVAYPMEKLLISGVYMQSKNKINPILL